MDDDCSERTARIRNLNDAFRRAVGTGEPGRYLVTRALAVRPDAQLFKLWEQVREFDDFTPGNDPYGEHDFGAFVAGDLGQLFWKIDYYDKSMAQGSEDPANPDITTRVLTLMTAFEY